jgi:hypothetical protein
MNEVLLLNPVSFSSRFIDSLIAPNVFLWTGVLVLMSCYQTYIWILTFLFIAMFFRINFRAMKVLVTKIEVIKGSLEITYLKFDKQTESLKIPLNEITVNYFCNGKGISSLLSNHIGIGEKGNVLIRQYKTRDWNLEQMILINGKLKELRRKATVKSN